MIIEFFQQILCSAIFFLGIVGVGIVILRLLKYEAKNVFLEMSVGFFISLCFFIIFAVLLLFVVPNKLLFLKLFSIVYFLASFLMLYHSFKRKTKYLKEFLKDNRWVFLALVIASFLFFLQLYHTSILDEWLHRPIVKFFTENGIFPLKNPLSPNSDYIYTYHYGSEIFSSAIQLLSRIGVSESLDIFKMSFFLGGFFLFYGIVLKWSNRKKWYSIAGAIFALFCGASFFLIDAFSTGYLWKVKAFEQLWVMNAPFSFAICSINAVGNFLAVAFIVLIDDIFYRKNNFSITCFAILSILFAGFFLLGEVFATLSLTAAALTFLYKIAKKEVKIGNILVPGLVFIFLLSIGIYFSGGVVGNIVQQEWNNLNRIIEIRMAHEKIPISSAEGGGPRLFSVRNVPDWGYASLKDIMKIWEHPLFYLRNFLLEIILFAIFIWAFIKKKIKFSDNHLMFSLVIFCFGAPFFLSTSWGDLNFYKITVLGLAVLHLLAFYLFSEIESKKLFFAVFTLFALGIIPQILIPFNIQWGIFPKGGRDIRCSENPDCYKKDDVKILGDFEKNNPGLKTVLNKGGSDAQKIVDLSNSYSVVADNKDLSYDYLKKNSVDYILNNLESEGKFDVSKLESSGEATEISNNGKYEIFKVNY